MNPRTRIVAAGALISLIAVVAVVFVAPRLRNAIAGADGIHDVAALPRQIRVCNRSWQRDARDATFISAQKRELLGGGVVVDPAALESCPAGPCTDVAQAGACDTVVWVRVGDDAYVRYGLQGGP